MNRLLNFITAFARNPRNVGSIMESTRYAAEKMVAPADFSTAKRCVEFGAGTGSVTLEIIKRLAPDARLLVFEIDQQLYATLQQRCGTDPRVRCINDSAERLSFYCHQEGWNHVDLIISELPIATLPKEVTERIWQQVEALLTPSGRYIQIQFSLMLRSLLEKRFYNVEMLFEPRNVPPAFVFSCQTRRP